MENKLLDKFDWKYWLKWGIVILTVLVAVRQILFFTFSFRSVGQRISHISAEQKKESIEFHKKVDAKANDIQDRMIDGADLIADKADHMEEKMDAFLKNFTESFDRMVAQREQRFKAREEWEIIKRQESIEENKRREKEEKEEIKRSMAESKRKKEKRFNEFMIKMKPKIECEKKKYGWTSYRPGYYDEYSDPFPDGLPDMCKEFDKRKKV